MKRPLRTGPESGKFVTDEIECMLEHGIIEPAKSEWASPLVVAPTSDGYLRFCVDYRKLNAMNIRDTYPLPRIGECIDRLGDAKIFSSLDANWGYWQIPVEDEDKDKTTFTSHSETYRFNRMPFGLMNAPSTFQRTLDFLLNRYNCKTCLVYLDDIIIFSKDPGTHLLDVEKVLETLRRSGVSLKLKLCELFTTSIKYLCHIIKPGKHCINDAHTRSLLQAKHPRTITELRSFLGLCNVYRRFVPDFSDVSATLNRLLKKDMPDPLSPFQETESKVFDRLIQAIVKPPVLELPKHGLPYTIDTDASD